MQETQFVIDQGGQPTTTGAIFTFRGDLRGDGLSPKKDVRMGTVKYL